MANFEIEAVEYPVDEYPPRHCMFDYNDGNPNFLRLLIDEEPDDGDLVRVWWNTEHTCNDSTSTIPQAHDHIISLGCEGYALLLRAVQEAELVITDMAALRTLIGTTASFTNADAALTDLGSTAAGLIKSAIDTWTEEVKHIRTDVNQLDAHEYLDAGDARLNKFNKGRNVPDQYVLFAQTCLDMAKHYAQMRQDYLTAGRLQVDAASTYVREQETITQQATQYVGNIGQGVSAVQMLRQDGLERIGRFKELLKELKNKEQQRQKSVILLSSPWEDDD